MKKSGRNLTCKMSDKLWQQVLKNAGLDNIVAIGLVVIIILLLLRS